MPTSMSRFAMAPDTGPRRYTARPRGMADPGLFAGIGAPPRRQAAGTGAQHGAARRMYHRAVVALGQPRGRPDLECRLTTEFDTSLAGERGGRARRRPWPGSMGLLAGRFHDGPPVAPIGHAVQDRFAYYLVATESRFGSTKVRRFLDWFTAIGNEWSDPPSEWRLAHD